MWPPFLRLRLSALSALCYTNVRWLTYLYLCVNFVSFIIPFVLNHDMNITRSEHHVSVAASLEIHLTLNSLFRNKAVSDGTLSFYHDHFLCSKGLKITGANLWVLVGTIMVTHLAHSLNSERYIHFILECKEDEANTGHLHEQVKYYLFSWLFTLYIWLCCRMFISC